MKVKALLNIGTNDLPDGLTEGSVGDVSQADGIRLIRNGWAVEIPQEVTAKLVAAEPEVLVTPEPVEVAVSKPTKSKAGK